MVRFRKEDDVDLDYLENPSRPEGLTKDQIKEVIVEALGPGEQITRELLATLVKGRQLENMNSVFDSWGVPRNDYEELNLAFAIAPVSNQRQKKGIQYKAQDPVAKARAERQFRSAATRKNLANAREKGLKACAALPKAKAKKAKK